MTTQLFIQKFHQGEPVAMPYDEVLDCLKPHGQLGRGPVGDLEINFTDDEVAHFGLLVGDEVRGVQCIGFVRPCVSNALRYLAFELMSRFGACVFDDALGAVFLTSASPGDLPPELAATSVSGVQQVASPQQLWPDGLVFPAPAKDLPALLFDNPNPQGPKYLLFDEVEAEKKHLHMVLDTRPEACNAGTLRVLRNLLLKADVALSSNAGFHPFYRFAHHEAQLRLLESPQIGEMKHGGTFVVSGEALFGAEAPAVVFTLEPELYFTNRDKAAQLQQRAEADFQIPVTFGSVGIPALERLLERVHRQYLVECAGAPGRLLFSDKAVYWADRAGAWLGEWIRREVGGQWGCIEVLGQKTPMVQTHTGRNCWPKQQALNRIINGGGGESLNAWFDELLRNAKTPSQVDIVADIPLLSHILTGRGQFSSGGLPLLKELPTDRLDFSVPSLRALDNYLAVVHAHIRGFDDISASALSNLTLAAGAYLGEVFRRHTRELWGWINYADYFSTRPANPDLPRSFNSIAMLVGAGHVVLPMQVVNVKAWGATPESAHQQAQDWLERFGAAAKPAPAANAPAEPESRAFPDLQTDIRACMAALAPEDQGYVRIPLRHGSTAIRWSVCSGTTRFCCRKGAWCGLTWSRPTWLCSSQGRMTLRQKFCSTRAVCSTRGNWGR